MLAPVSADAFGWDATAGRRRRVLRHPAQIVVIAFAVADLVGVARLAMTVSRAGDGSAPLITALFTSTSAVCVTGLSTVDTATYWSTFGKIVIAGLIQIGGFGIMTLASLLALFVTRKMAGVDRRRPGYRHNRDDAGRDVDGAVRRGIRLSAVKSVGPWRFSRDLQFQQCRVRAL